MHGASRIRCKIGSYQNSKSNRRHDETGYMQFESSDEFVSMFSASVSFKIG
jgi:hypothetical protein